MAVGIFLFREVAGLICGLFFFLFYCIKNIENNQHFFTFSCKARNFYWCLHLMIALDGLFFFCF